MAVTPELTETCSVTGGQIPKTHTLVLRPEEHDALLAALSDQIDFHEEFDNSVNAIATLTLLESIMKKLGDS